MIQKVSSALSKFIAPVASSKTSSQERSQDQKNSQQGFQKFTPEPKLKLVKPSGEEPKALESSHEVSIRNLSVAHAFVQLLNKLNEQRTKLSKWIGVHSYESAARKQKRAGKARKGTMFDENVG